MFWVTPSEQFARRNPCMGPVDRPAHRWCKISMSPAEVVLDARRSASDTAWIVLLQEVDPSGLSTTASGRRLISGAVDAVESRRERPESTADSTDR